MAAYLAYPQWQMQRSSCPSGISMFAGASPSNKIPEHVQVIFIYPFVGMMVRFGNFIPFFLLGASMILPHVDALIGTEKEQKR